MAQDPQDRKPDDAGLSPVKRALLERMTRGLRVQAPAPARRAPAASVGVPSIRQRQMWLVEKLSPGTPVHNQAFVIGISGPLDARALGEAIHEVIRRHDTLRTAFVEREGGPVTVVSEAASSPLQITDVSGEADAVRAHAEAIAQPFDLTRPPLLRAYLYRVDPAQHSPAQHSPAQHSPARHYLAFVVHHIVFDGWSAGVLGAHVAEHYQLARGGSRDKWDSLPWQYADFTTWQDALPRADALQFWRRALENAAAPVGFASGRAGSGDGFRRGLYRAPISPALRRELAAWCRSEKISLFTALLGAFHTLLHRVSGRDDLIVGSPFANRTRPEAGTLIGPCFNVFPMRASFEDQPSFVRLARRLQAFVDQVREIEAVPFEVLDGDALGSGAQAARYPMWFSLQNFPFGAGDVGDTRWEPALLDSGMHNGGTRLELGVALVDSAGGMFGMWDYDLDKLQLSEVTELARYYERVLEAVLADPHRALAEIPLDHAGLASTRASTAPARQLLRIDEQFDQQRARTPERVAIVSDRGGEGRPCSYGELAAHADRIAAELRGRGVAAGSLVGICMARSELLVAAMLGIWKAGAAYLPLDPSHPQARTQLILDDARVAFIIIDETTAEALPPGDFEQLPIDRLVAARPGEAPAPAPVAGDTHLEELAYVLYTSGSTGKPKGVEITHRSLSNFIGSMRERPGLSAEDVLVAVTTVSFDISGLEIWLPLTAGARLVMASSETAGDGRALARLLHDTRATVMQATPSSWRMLLEAGFTGRITMLCGGEALPQPLARRLRDLGGELWNLYGPTETTIWSSAAHIGEDCDITLGEPIAETQLHVLDASIRPVPRGIAGELYIGGVGLARGYRNRPDLTAERFVPDPFGEAGGRLYRTGDVVRAHPDGGLEFVGRVDQQVKVRGHRIDLGEIDAALVAAEGVRSGAVIASQDGTGGDTRLLAFVTAAPDTVAAWRPSLLEEHRAAWQRVWNDTYGGSSGGTGGGPGDGASAASSGSSAAPSGSSAAPDDPQFDIAGWRSSYTGLPIPDAEMREWVELSVANILELRPRRVLEIGCGTGLLALRVAPHCEEYVATDASPTVLAQLDRSKGSLPIRTVCREAADPGDTAPASFDVVVVNSVVQYLGGEDELSRVLDNAIRATAPGGAVYVGDVRNLAVLDAFYASLEATAQPRVSRARLRDRIARRRKTERELVIHPRYFQGLRRRYPSLTVEIRPKRGAAQNEVTRYRCDVTLRVGAEAARDDVAAWRDWRAEAMTPERLARELAALTDGRIAFANIPNARVVADAALVSFSLGGPGAEGAEGAETAEQLLASIGASGAASSRDVIDPEALRRVAAEAGVALALGVSGAGRGDTFEAVFARDARALGAPTLPASAAPTADAATDVSAAPAADSATTNDPLGLAIERELVARARQTLEARLPSYMMPARFVVLPELPFTPNGKIDRKALTSKISNAVEEAEYVAPRNETEAAAAEIWAGVLGVDRVGVEDDFFHLGGNSLLAVKALARVTQTFTCDLSIRDLFEHRTLGAFAARIGSAPRAAEATPAVYAGPPTLSYGQERLFFLDQLEPGNTTYNMTAAIRMEGPLDIAALQATLAALTRRHTVLATSYVLDDGLPAPKINEVSIDLEPVDLRALAEPERSERVAALGREAVKQPFNLAEDAPLRVKLLRLADLHHVLLLTLHHIAVDGWSIAILVRDISVLYAAGGDPARAGLPALPMQYADFAGWQRAWLEDGRLAQGLAFWKRALEDYPFHLRLPTDRPRPQRASGRGRRFWFHFPARLITRLHELAAREHATLFMALLSGMGVLLGRYSGEPRVVVGAAVANRIIPEIENLVGFFVNSLALPVDLSRDPTVRELLARVRTTTLDGLANGAVPFEQVVDEVLPARDLSRHPIFQVLLILQNAPQAEVELRGLRLTVDEIDPESSRFDIGISAHETADGLKGMIEYAVDLFDEATMDRMMRHLERILTWMVDHPDARLSTLGMLSAEEQHQIVRGWNATHRPYAAEKCIHELVEAQARRTPDLLAVDSETGRVTYAELDRRANQLAHHLRRLGVGPEVLVGLSIDRSAEMFIALLAILKAGGAYLPLDPTYPQDRLAFMLEDCAVKVVLTRTRGAGDWAAMGVEELYLDEAAAQLAAEPETPPPSSSIPTTLPTNLAYVIYTSGSTGRPKGVGCPHTGVVNLIAEVETWVPLAAGFRGGQWTSLSFDASIYEIFAVWAFGGTLCAVPEGVRADGTMLLDWVEEHRIESAYLPPHVLPALAERAERVGAAFPLRRLLIGIEPIPEELLARIRRPLPGMVIVNAYGPTETTVMATRHFVVRDDATGQTPIGTPIANTTTYVLDRDFHPVPVGAVGELWIGGDGQTRGYLNRPGFTAERFVPNPFGEGGSRLYASGDLVRYLKSGEIEFVGRADHQIKIRGFRVELGEIEAVLAAQPGVREAAVVAHTDEQGQKRIVGYVAGDALDTAALRASLRTRLPDHMVPALFVVLDALPQTPSGKIDRKSLPAPSWRGDAEHYVAPRTDAERRLAEVWQTVLRVPRVGISDNFFELGGDSIIAIQVVSRARAAGVPITPRQLFEHQTVEELARLVVPGRTIVAEQGTVQGDVEATPIIARFLEEEIEDRGHFNQAIVLELQEPADPVVLRAAWADVLAHHDALRMRLRPREGGEGGGQDGGGGWALRIEPEETRKVFEVVDLQSLPGGGGFEAVSRRLHTSLDLAEGPLVRAALVVDGARAQRLLVVIHHLVVDGVSWRVLLSDLEQAYRLRLAGQPAAFEPKTSSFQQWAERLAAHAVTPEAERSLGLPYWTEQAAIKPAALPVDLEGGGNRVADADVVATLLDEPTTQAVLTELPEAYRTRINEALLAAVVRAFHGWLGADSLVVDLEGHGRDELFDDLDLSRTVGWFTSLFPVELRGGAAANTVETLRAVKERLRNIPHNGVGYGVLRYLGRPAVRAALAGAAAPAVSFNYLGQIDRAESTLFALSSEPAGQGQSERSRRGHLLEIEAQVSAGQLRVAIHYSRALHRRETIEAVAQAISRELSALVESCRSGATWAYSPSDFPLAGLSQAGLDALTGAERVEGLYPLSPLQEGMVFHAVADPTSKIYCEQLAGTLRGRLRASDLRRAWELLAQRHTVLRTVFHWKAEGRPLQLVRPTATVEWTALDLRAEADPRAAIDRYLEADRARGFELHRTPPWRVALMQLRDDEHVIAFTHHHIILDGWSYSVMFRDLLELYGSLERSPDAGPGPIDSYERFISWIETRDRARAFAFWQASLAGFSTATLLTQARPSRTQGGGDSAPFDEHAVEISAATTAALEGLARASQLTVSGLVSTAWAVLLSRHLGRTDLVFGMTESGRPPDLAGIEEAVGLFINTVPLRVAVDDGERVEELARRVVERSLETRDHGWYPLPEIQACSSVPRGTPMFDTIIVFENYPLDRAVFRENSGLTFGDVRLLESTTFPLAIYALPGETLRLRFNYLGSVDRQFVVQLADQLVHLIDQIAKDPDRLVGRLDVLRPAEHRQIAAWNDTRAEVLGESIHALIEARARETPDAMALAFRGRSMTFRELDAAAERVARALRRHGARPDALVGVYLHRSLEMVIGLLGVLKAGAAYVPLDPTYPAQRISYVLADAQAPIVLTERSLAPRLAGASASASASEDKAGASPAVLEIEAILAAPDGAEPGEALPPASVHPDQLAYAIYTSGSSGNPKGVLVTHRNVQNFFVGMTRALGAPDPGKRRTWLAVTSISFDISVLELFWTLSTGDAVVVQEPDYVGPARPAARAPAAKPLEFSLFYFANDSGADAASVGGRYRLLTEGARFADTNGFAAVWTPERHFHSFGGLYPNPSVTSAALATITKRVGLRAGSVVMPLHHPVRVAEEWSVVDNLSGGRVGLSFATGWNSADFALAPDNFTTRRERTLEGIRTVRALWRGETVTLRAGTGEDVRIALYPPPVQRELPIWMTAAGNPETFALAGELGANLLTHLLGQSTAELKGKIALYRESRRRHGHPGDGHVTLMLHTYVGKNQHEARESVNAPLRTYLRSSTDLVSRFASAAGVPNELTPATLDRIVEHAFGRYYNESGLLGPIEACLGMVDRLREIDVDEVGCLIDFGVPTDSALDGLQRLAEVRDAANAANAHLLPVEDYSLPSQIARYGVTHLQCTPSLASALLLDPRTVEALRSLEGLLLGGEKLPTPLARTVARELPGTKLFNMYGPTETTIWSSTQAVDASEETIPIGGPIANTSLHVLDGALREIPTGSVGDLYIGGVGLARAYRGRPGLTAERFVPDPFATEPGQRLYATGDRALRRPDGTLEVLGRVDDQVKIRGHRVEPGEIEAALRRHPAVREAAVVARPSGGGGHELAGFWVDQGNAPGESTSEQALRGFLRGQLPEYMVPATIISLDALPKTPNGKIDRGALTVPEHRRPTRGTIVGARDQLELELVSMWEEALDVRPIGVTDNFFELGGHSFTALRLNARLQGRFGDALSIASLLQEPTVEGLARLLRSSSGPAPARALIPIQPKGTRPPLFCVYPVGGSVFGYSALGRQLAPDQPLLGLRAEGLEAAAEKGASVEAIAAHYAAVAREAFPSGPYRIAAWSTGGVIALELARQLRQAGHEVPLVALIESPDPAMAKAMLDLDFPATLAWFARDLAGIHQAAGRLAELDFAALSSPSGLDVLLAWGRKHHLIPPDTGRDDLTRILVAAQAMLRAIVAHDTAPYDGRVAAIAASGALGAASADGWAAVCRGPYERTTIPGDHYSIFSEPHVATLATALRNLIEEPS